VNAAAGPSWSLFIDEKGDLYGCGSNKHRQLGLDTTVTVVAEPVKIDVHNVISVACGRNYSKVVTCDGLYTMGGDDASPIEKEEIVKVAERPVCRRRRTMALHCHACGVTDGLFLHKQSQRILCSMTCHSKYKAFRVCK